MMMAQTKGRTRLRTQALLWFSDFSQPQSDCKGCCAEQKIKMPVIIHPISSKIENLFSRNRSRQIEVIICDSIEASTTQQKARDEPNYQAYRRTSFTFRPHTS